MSSAFMSNESHRETVYYLAGIKAYHDGWPINHNPYPIGSYQREEWERGFLDA